MTKWEYTSLTQRAPNISTQSLCLLGLDGWEMVSVTTTSDKYLNFMTTAYFKRRITNG